MKMQEMGIRAMNGLVSISLAPPPSEDCVIHRSCTQMADNDLSSEVPPTSAAITPEFVAQQTSSFEADPILRLAQ